MGSFRPMQRWDKGKAVDEDLDDDNIWSSNDALCLNSRGNFVAGNVDYSTLRCILTPTNVVRNSSRERVNHNAAGVPSINSLLKFVDVSWPRGTTKDEIDTSMQEMLDLVDTKPPAKIESGASKAASSSSLAASIRVVTALLKESLAAGASNR